MYVSMLNPNINTTTIGNNHKIHKSTPLSAENFRLIGDILRMKLLIGEMQNIYRQFSFLLCHRHKSQQ